MKRFVIALAASLAFCSSAHAATPSPLLSRVASTYVGHPVTIQCASDAEFATALVPDAAGFAEVDAATATLRADECASLIQLARGKGNPQIEGRAALVITHEATHLTGVIDEGQTECLAVHNVWRVLRMFPKNDAQRLRFAYRAAVYLHTQEPAPYRSVC